MKQQGYLLVVIALSQGESFKDRLRNTSHNEHNGAPEPWQVDNFLSILHGTVYPLTNILRAGSQQPLLQ